MLDTDVIIVGFGPTGKVLAARLLEAGHRVAIVERWPQAYPLPRAIGYDHEARRIFYALGVGPDIDAISAPMGVYTWYNADWKVMIALDQMQESISGGAVGYSFDQPGVERILERRLEGQRELQRFTSHEAVAVRDLDGHVEVDIAPCDPDTGKVWDTERKTLCGRYVIGCDGANSIVRSAMGGLRDDLGFDEPWLVVDVAPKPGVTLDIPYSAQWCNPVRPTTIVPSGAVNRRWEFMLLPGETEAGISTSERVWELLSPWITPDQGSLIRRATYRFRSMLARGWRRGRMLIAGDAAHLMPPFMGQGLCGGVRDAWNLAWKLDLVLRGLADQALLDQYERERSPHIEAVTRISMELGRVICVSDPEAAARRDAAFFSGDLPPPPQFPPLCSGVIARTADGKPQLAGGELMPHDVLEKGGERRRLDDLAAGGFVLVSTRPLDDPRLDRLGIVPVVLGADGWRDVDGRLTAWLERNRAIAYLQRPDFYGFGAISRAEDFSGLLDELEQALIVARSA
ncbi:MAG: bifunctional 3-(3-hydroxy-phenyl)propionate/3-hydroxycinnamic acid hydroxylase [Rhodobacteraceae bacterium]|nr:bifunctional 3-(3-hydroxy-phenyl)propionate/3-hydroxycinnamic acid hydroxylase [Paracoccaceae bacterium]